MLEKMKKYQPISCSFHDHLEAWATTQADCKIKFRDSRKKDCSVTGKIKDIYTRNGIEFMVIDNGTKIRLDQLIHVNGKHLQNYY